MIAFSPRINHALAFAAKHHDGQLRKMRGSPYIVHPMAVALILARYGRPEDEIIAGLLHDVPEDCASTNREQSVLTWSIAGKFGARVGGIVESVTEDKRDGNDLALDVHVRRRLYLDGVEAMIVSGGSVGEGAAWVCAADKVHNGSTLITDLLHAEDRDRVWNVFSGGKDAVVSWYRSVHTMLRNARFDGAIMEELNYVATMIESAAITNEADLPHEPRVPAGAATEGDA